MFITLEYWLDCQFYTLLQGSFCLGERSSDLDNMHSLYGP